MNYISSILLISFITLTSTARSQSDLFHDIALIDKISEVKDMKMIYFHFEGCPPCKRMDNEVLSEEYVKLFLKNSFDCYSVYGFDSLETHYRMLFEVKLNPCFLFVDSSNTIKHKFVGYFEPKRFIEECKKVMSDESLSALENKYLQNMNDLMIVRNYICAKKDAGELTDDLIDYYLEMIPKDSLFLEKYRNDVLRLGYYKGQRIIKYDSDLFQYLVSLFNKVEGIQYKECIRTRIIFSISDKLYDEEIDEQKKMDLIEEMSKYENGEKIILKDLDAKYFYAFFEDRYPSFVSRYNIALQNKDSILASNIFIKHFNERHYESEELNNLAWGIFVEDYKEDLELGIDIIKQALELKEHYNYYDTYSSLLYKIGRLKEAKEMALKAIHLANENDFDFVEAKDLLAKINKSMAKN